MLKKIKKKIDRFFVPLETHISKVYTGCLNRAANLREEIDKAIVERDLGLLVQVLNAYLRNDIATAKCILKIKRLYNAISEDEYASAIVTVNLFEDSQRQHIETRIEMLRREVQELMNPNKPITNPPEGQQRPEQNSTGDIVF